MHPDDPQDPTGTPARLPRSERPSRTQLKKESHELQSLGEDLLELNATRLAALNLPENLLDALRELRRVRSHEGRRRQLQFVGKLMRFVDPEPLREAVAAQRMPSAKDTLALHQTERWRDRLIADDEALTEWLRLHPDTDVQAMRSLIRQCRKETQQAADAQAHDGAPERKGRSYRELFQTVKAQLEADARAAAGGADDDDDLED
jgi:ribosome-associated protein